MGGVIIAELAEEELPVGARNGRSEQFGMLVFVNSEAELCGKIHHESRVEVGKGGSGIEDGKRLVQKAVHRFVGHRMAENTIEDFGEEKFDGGFVICNL